MKWHEHFGLSHAPFSKDIADRDLWLTPAKTAAVDELAEAVEERNCGALLVGDSGDGKSCVLRALRYRLADTPVRLTYCHNATLGRRDFYRQICRALGLNPKATAAAVFNTIATTSATSAASNSTRCSSSTRPTCSTRTCSTTCTSWPTTSGTRSRS